MLGSRIATQCNALKATRMIGNFGGTRSLCKIRTSDQGNQRTNLENSSMNKDGGKNLSDSSRVPSYEGENSVPRRVLKEINGEESRFGNTASLDQKITKEVDEMLAIEEHHVVEIIKDSSGKVRDVVWCPSYVHPALKEARGGDEISHHRCKSCQKISFHLLYDGTKIRPCLECAGWSEKNIPSWYYHNGCKYCKLK